jgi:hypothetical protein
MVQKNEVLPSNRKLTVSVASIDALVSEVVAGVSDVLGSSGGDYFVSMPAGSASEAVALTDLGDLGAKAKIMLWRVAEAASAAAAAQEAVSATSEVSGSRDITLMVQKNALVPSNRKLSVNVADVGALRDAIVAAVGLGADAEYFVSMPAASAEQATALSSLDELGAKAKVQVWAMVVEEAVPPPAAAPAGELRYAGAPRKFTVLVQKNELVTSNRKMAVTAAGALDGIL